MGTNRATDALGRGSCMAALMRHTTQLCAASASTEAILTWLLFPVWYGTVDLAVIPCLVIRHTTKEELSKDGPSLVGILGWSGVICLPCERGLPQEYEDIPSIAEGLGSILKYLRVVLKSGWPGPWVESHAFVVDDKIVQTEPEHSAMREGESVTGKTRGCPAL